MVSKVLSRAETVLTGRPLKGIGSGCTAQGDGDALLLGGVSPSLVDREHNSAKCRKGIWMQGRCEHGDERYIRVPCKRRNCPDCGPVGRARIARRIAFGIREIGVARCASLCLTLDGADTKAHVVERLAAFVRWLRTFSPSLAYASTFEIQPGTGNLHVNLVCGPWVWVDQLLLCERWGGRIWVEWVRDETSMSREMSKPTDSPETLAQYVAKAGQQVATGRRVSFSRNWPKLPVANLPGVTWEAIPPLEVDEFVAFLEQGLRLGFVVEIAPGEYSAVGLSQCDCFRCDSGALLHECEGG